MQGQRSSHPPREEPSTGLRTSGVRRLPGAVPVVALIGNPNTGKTTLFNALTGARARVGNYPGVTVERRVGTVTLPSRRIDGDTWSPSKASLLDLPGCYSLSARSHEEQIAIDALLGLDPHGDMPTPSLVVAVVDAGQLIRNLYLVLQLIELGVPLVVVLNMVDEAGDDAPAPEALAELLGVPVVATSARSGRGVDLLRGVVAEALQERPVGRLRVVYPDALEADLDAVAAKLPERWFESDQVRRRALALWALSSIDDDDELAHIDEGLRRVCLARHAASGERDIDGEIVAARYAVLDAEVGALVSGNDSGPRDDERPARPAVALTDRIDRVVLHPVWGFAVFLALMLVLFQTLFAWSDPLIGLIEGAFGWLGDAAKGLLPEGLFADLVTQGVIAGVGNVVVFLPQIVLLFLLLGLLEDSGYMARAAYLMDRVMKTLGLHGRAFVPMMSGCACAIPAIMATRTMERYRDRLLTMMVIPLMTCSARLPVYTLVIAALFPPSHLFGFLPVQGLLLVGMYLFATFVTLLAAGVLGRTLIRGRHVPLLLELPPYRLPTGRSVVRQAVERAGGFLKEAGSIILVCTIGLWLLLSFPKVSAEAPAPPPSSPSAAVIEQADDAGMRQLRQSYAGRLGRAIEPAIAPLGFDWKIGIGLIGAFSAREVFVSTMGVVYGIAEADEESQPLRDHMRAEVRPDGSPVYTPLMGMSLLVFFALACQCMSTLAVVRRETKSWKWPAIMFAYMTALAYIASLVVYQGGKLLGLG